MTLTSPCLGLASIVPGFGTKKRKKPNYKLVVDGRFDLVINCQQQSLLLSGCFIGQTIEHSTSEPKSPPFEMALVSASMLLLLLLQKGEDFFLSMQRSSKRQSAQSAEASFSSGSIAGMPHHLVS